MKQNTLQVPGCRKRVTVALEKIKAILSSAALTAEELKRWTDMQALLIFGKDGE